MARSVLHSVAQLHLPTAKTPSRRQSMRVGQHPGLASRTGTGNHQPQRLVDLVAYRQIDDAGLSVLTPIDGPVVQGTLASGNLPGMAAAIVGEKVAGVPARIKRNAGW